MNILHYSLGFAPYRTGGLTKYCTDLMKIQLTGGNNVGLLWPGRMKVVGTQVKIKQGKAVDGIKNYEIINPLPVPLDEGIIEVDKFTQKANKKLQKFALILKNSLNIRYIHLTKAEKSPIWKSKTCSDSRKPARLPSQSKCEIVA